jgi:hypothetical protein
MLVDPPQVMIRSEDANPVREPTKIAAACTVPVVLRHVRRVQGDPFFPMPTRHVLRCLHEDREPIKDGSASLTQCFVPRPRLLSRTLRRLLGTHSHGN